MPAYLADLFGTKFVGGIHGRLLTAWSLAGIMGPVVLTTLRQHSVTTAIHDLSRQVDRVQFEAAFGAGKDDLEQLIEAKSVTIARLMEIAPEGTVDPTPFLYNTTMYTMAGMLSVALVSNALLRPVNSKFHMK